MNVIIHICLRKFAIKSNQACPLITVWRIIDSHLLYEGITHALLSSFTFLRGYIWPCFYHLLSFAKTFVTLRIIVKIICQCLVCFILGLSLSLLTIGIENCLALIFSFTYWLLRLANYLIQVKPWKLKLLLRQWI